MSSIKDFLKEIYKDPLNESAIQDYGERTGTSSPSMDYMLDGGIVPGRFYGLIGAEQCGKTMFCVNIVHELLLKNPDSVVYWFDAEHSFTTHWIDVFFKPEERHLADQIIVRPTQSSKEIFDFFVDDIMDKVDRGLKVSACVIDSIQQIIGPKEENNQSVEDYVVADLAQIMTKAIKKIIKPAREARIPWFFISQARENFENAGKKYILKENKYGQSGGRALKHGIDVNMQFEAYQGKTNSIYDQEIKTIDGNPLKVGHLIKVIFTKNRLGEPGKKGQFLFHYSKGMISKEKEIADLSLNLGIVKTEKRSYMLDGEKIAVGEEDFWNVIEKDEKIRNRILENIKLKYKASSTTSSIIQDLEDDAREGNDNES